MKRVILTIGIVLCSYTLHSQVLISLLLGDKLNSDKLEFGLETGINFEQIEGFESNDRRTFFNIGFYFDLKLKNPDWSVYTGVLVKANQGLDNLTDNDLDFLGIDKQEHDGVIVEGDYRQVINTFMVPALLKYKFYKGFYAEGGMQFGWHSKAYVEFNSDNDDIEERVRYKNKDAIQKIDAGLLGGFGYQFKKGKKMTVGAKYYHGLVDIYKERSGTKSNAFFVKVTFPVGVKKAKEKAAEKEQELLDKQETTKS